MSSKTSSGTESPRSELALMILRLRWLWSQQRQSQTGKDAELEHETANFCIVIITVIIDCHFFFFLSSKRDYTNSNEAQNHSHELTERVICSRKKQHASSATIEGIKFWII